MLDRHDDDIMLETAICKVFCSEYGWRTVNDAMQIMGGWLADRFGPHKVLVVLSLIWGAATLLTGFVGSLVALLILRLPEPKYVWHEEVAARDEIREYFEREVRIQQSWQEILRKDAPAGEHYQFLREGYFCADLTTTPEAPVFNRTVGLKDSYKA